MKLGQNYRNEARHNPGVGQSGGLAKEPEME